LRSGRGSGGQTGPAAFEPMFRPKGPRFQLSQRTDVRRCRRSFQNLGANGVEGGPMLAEGPVRRVARRKHKAASADGTARRLLPEAGPGPTSPGIRRGARGMVGLGAKTFGTHRGAMAALRVTGRLTGGRGCMATMAQ